MLKQVLDKSQHLFFFPSKNILSYLKDTLLSISKHLVGLSSIGLELKNDNKVKETATSDYKAN